MSTITVDKSQGRFKDKKTGQGNVFHGTYSSVPCFVKEVPIDCYRSDAFLRGGTRICTENQFIARLNTHLTSHREYVDHPNILHIFGFQIDGLTLRLAMEKVDTNLIDYVNTNEMTDEIGRPTQMAVGLIRGIYKGLRSLHKRQVCCRQLRPSNILVRSDGRVKIDPLTDSSRLDLLWTAPEENVRQTSDAFYKTADAFRFGQVVYYIVTNGKVLDGQRGSLETSENEEKYIMWMNSDETTYARVLDRQLEGLRTEVVEFVRPFLSKHYRQRPIKLNKCIPFFWTYDKIYEFVLSAGSFLLNDKWYYVKKYNKLMSLEGLLNRDFPDKGRRKNVSWKDHVDPLLLRDVEKSNQERIERKYINKEKKNEEIAKLLDRTCFETSVSVPSFIVFFRTVLAHGEVLQNDTIEKLQGVYGESHFIEKHLLGCYDKLVSVLRNAFLDMGFENHHLMKCYLK